MPRSIRNRYEKQRVIQDVLDLCVSDQLERFQTNANQLNADQLIIFNTIMKVLDDSDVYLKVLFSDQ